MTIIDIFVLCHVHAIAEPLSSFRLDSPAGRLALSKLTRWGWIVPDEHSGSGFKTTERGAEIVERMKEISP